MAAGYEWAFYDREFNRPTNLGDQPFRPLDDHAGYDDDEWAADDVDEDEIEDEDYEPDDVFFPDPLDDED